MIVHTIDLRESGPGGLIAVLEPHDFQRSREVEAQAVGPDWGDWYDCHVDGCDRRASYEVTVHRRYSKRASETAYLCADHLEAHRTNTSLRLHVESNR